MRDVTRCMNRTENSVSGTECEDGESSETVSVEETPSIMFESITFSDGTVINLEVID